MYYVVKYSGIFGFIKPWTAVRDSKTFSQQFLTPSIIEGIEKKLFPELLDRKGIFKIIRHKLTYSAISVQQEQTQPRGWEYKKKMFIRQRSILERGVMLEPLLALAFDNQDDAQRAATQHICLCRNEDVLLPLEVERMEEAEFEHIDGFELRFGEEEAGALLAGFNRFNDANPMYGRLEITGKPVKGL
ncbi:MAG: hypothetical protein LBR18_09125 [Tannerella sp.]|jgi:hypothetical protein|nr:hypothetical protein [Tannerella sp.]